jgi:large subunit ribosomal protein L21
MNTVIVTGGKQYTVQTDDIVTVEKLDGEIGTKVSFPSVLSYENGKVNAKAGNVTATIVEHGKGVKINGFKYKPKNNVRKKWGHRQSYTKVKIDAAGANGAKGGIA